MQLVNTISSFSFTQGVIAQMEKLKNIARGTTDPEIDSVTWTKFSDHMAALVTNLATI